MTRRHGRLERFVALVAAGLVLVPAPAALSAGSSVDPDETVVLFPTNAHLDEAAGAWRVPLHGWIFEMEEDSLWRGAVVGGLLDRLELDPGQVAHVFIRQVPGHGVTAGRYEAAFAEVPEDRWTVFHDPGVLGAFDPMD